MQMRKRKTIGIEEAAVKCIGAKVVNVPAEVVAAFPRNKSVWSSFYAWLVREHGAVEGGPTGLHNRTYAGKQLMSRLGRAQAQYIRRLHPAATKEQVENTTAFSSVNSGPQEIFAECRLDGDALFFLPPDAAEPAGSPVPPTKPDVAPTPKRGPKPKQPDSPPVSHNEYNPGGDPLDNIARGLFAIAKELSGIKTHIKYLGVGDAATTMGAIEYLAAQAKEGADGIAAAIREARDENS